jgi:hypothetical protein
MQSDPAPTDPTVDTETDSSTDPHTEIPTDDSGGANFVGPGVGLEDGDVVGWPALQYLCKQEKLERGSDGMYKLARK